MHFSCCFLLESMRKVVFCRRKTAVWRAELDDGDLCCSRFGTTKYACLKCKIPICNKCSISKKMFIFGAHDLTINLSPKINIAQFVTLDLRNISNLLRWICVTFPVCGCFCCSHPNLKVIYTVNV